MGRLDITVEVCGMAGDGTIAAGGLLNQAMSDGGFHVLGFDSYPAEIRGFGRCVTRSRIGSEEILALTDTTHVLISLDDEQSKSRIPFLDKDSAVFFDNNPPSYVDEGHSIAAQVRPGVMLYGIPFADLATAAAGTPRGKNLTALGGFAAVYGMNADLLRNVITTKFSSKGEKVVKANIKSFEAGYEYAMEHFSDYLKNSLGNNVESSDEKRVMYSGNLAIGKAALDADLKLYFGYPITPATPIMEYLAKELPKKDGKVIQMEDEISSIAAVLGSYFAGARSMTATSGPGLALMTELITWGVMTETPAVILDAQRGGPATGLPTKTEQSDLHAAVFGGPGDSPRIVIAPTNVSECYHHTLKSFQLAEKYQTPVIVLTDFFLDNRVENIIEPEASEAEKANGNIVPDDSTKYNYERFSNTDSGISPRSVPGMEGFVFTATGLEHTTSGTPSYESENHKIMCAKRERKINRGLEDLPTPIEYFNEEQTPDVGVIGWGSTFGSVLEAVDIVRRNGIKAQALKIISIYPYHEAEIRTFMSKCKDVLIPELNHSGQLANLIGHLYNKDVIRLSSAAALPMTPQEIALKIESIVEASK